MAMGDISHQKPGFLVHKAVEYHARTGLPLVTVSYAQTLDGCLTLKRGQSSPVSSQAAMKITHQLRAAHDAILVGIDTLLADNPRLTVRLAAGPNPLPIVLDSHLRMPLDAALLSHPRGVIIATTEQADHDRHDALIAAGGTLWVLPSDQDNRVSLNDLLGKLGKMKINSLMVEGGSQVISSFLREGLANCAIITIAPVFAAGYHAVRDLHFTDWGALPRLVDMQSITVDNDLIVWGDISR